VAITEYDPIYHTYPVLSTNCLDQATRREFDHALGLPIKATDPNLVDTMFRYDGFGRMIELRKPGDEEGLPTVAITTTTGSSHWVERRQKRGDGGPVFTLRHTMRRRSSRCRPPVHDR
jgi:YD repeat-containing protein